MYEVAVASSRIVGPLNFVPTASASRRSSANSTRSSAWKEYAVTWPRLLSVELRVATVASPVAGGV